jgi:hypothetical protein
MTKSIAMLLCFCLLATSAWGNARQVSDYHWTDVKRIVAIGDIHGDYDQYMKALTAAGLVDRRGRWAGGETHLVQTGDIPDRGPDTRKIIEHLQDLKKQARKDGGRVHALIGNHEAMNVYGDLRYVTAGEYEAFKSQNSKRYQELLWERTLENLKTNDPEGFAKLDLDDYRREWENNYPLGWNEHRQAWLPDGEFGQWVLDSPVAVKVNDTLFLHGGLSAKYCKNTLADYTEQVHDGLENYDFRNPGIVEDEFGPLWYRGLAVDAEETRADMVTAILERYEASRIVVGHTPTQGVVWPRFDGRVVLNDTGLAKYYGGHNAFLEITSAGAVAHYGEQSLPLPTSNAERIDYLKQVVALNPANAHLQSRLQKMIMAERRAADSSAGPAEAAAELTPEQAQIEAWLSPDNCR